MNWEAFIRFPKTSATNALEEHEDLRCLRGKPFVSAAQLATSISYSYGQMCKCGG